MKVTVFVPIQMEIKGDDKLSEVAHQLEILDKIINFSELSSNPKINIALVGDSEIVIDDEQ